MNAALIEHEALRLPVTERAVLIERLLESISSPTKSLRKSWISECDDRMEAYKNGQNERVDGETAISQSRAKLG